MNPNSASEPTIDRLRRGQHLLAAVLPRLRIRTKLAILLAFPLVALLFFPLNILWALVDKDRQFLHDRLAGTRLIKT